MEAQMEKWEKPRFVEISIAETGNYGTGSNIDYESFEFDQS